jgi:TonB family protein
VRVQLLPVSTNGRAQAMKGEGEWQSYAVTRNRFGVHVLLNGIQILSSGPLHASDGWIGFFAEGAGLDLRNVRLRRLFPSSSPGVGTREPTAPAAENGTADVARPGKDVTLPKLRHEVRPSYTSAALAAKIEGNVVVECVVATDGVVSKATIIRSLDDRFGLDEEALKAARQWRFEPAMRNGVPVPVVITIELSFTLKK